MRMNDSWSVLPGNTSFVVHVLWEAHKLCIAMSVTLGIAAVQKSAEDTLIGAELVQNWCRRCSDWSISKLNARFISYVC